MGPEESAKVVKVAQVHAARLSHTGFEGSGALGFLRSQLRSQRLGAGAGAIISIYFDYNYLLRSNVPFTTAREPWE